MPNTHRFVKVVKLLMAIGLPLRSGSGCFVITPLFMPPLSVAPFQHQPRAGFALRCAAVTPVLGLLPVGCIGG